MGVELRVAHLPARSEVRHAQSSHQRITAMFGQPPPTSLEEGLGRMAAWARSHGARAGKAFAGIEVDRNLPPAWRRP
jgi:UDP-glucose 4-epimerase